MESQFYTNYSDIKFIDKLKENIDLCQAFYFSVSFIKKPGLKLLAPNIEAAIARGARVLSGKLDDVPFVSLFEVESHWKGGTLAHCLM